MRMTHRSGAPPGFVMAILAAFVLMVGAPTLAEAKPNTPSLQLSAVQADMEHAVVGTNTISHAECISISDVGAGLQNNAQMRVMGCMRLINKGQNALVSKAGESAFIMRSISKHAELLFAQHEHNEATEPIGLTNNKGLLLPNANDVAWWRDWSQKRHEVSFG